LRVRRGKNARNTGFCSASTSGMLAHRGPAQDQAEYERSVKDFIALCIAEVPIVPLNQPSHDVAMQKAIGGYEFWFHREPDFRQFSKG
jgi:hypothetical protein